MAYWYVDGTFRPKARAIKKAIAVMKEYDCEYTQMDGTIEMHASIDDMDSYADDLAEALAPLMQEGDIEVKNDDVSDDYRRYVFHDGQYDMHPGTPFVYYSGDPNDFVEQLPDEIVQTVLHKYAPSTAPVAQSMQTTMNLSTAHLKPETRVWMEEHVDDHPWYSTQGGFFVPTTKTTWMFDLPKDLQRCFEYAASNGANYICFDDEFATISDLPVYKKQWKKTE